MLKPIRIHIGIAALFTAITVIFFCGMVGYLYYTNSELALRTASKSMQRAAIDVARSIDNLFGPAARIVEFNAFLIESGNAEVRGVSGMEMFFSQIQTQAYLDGMYVGYQKDGAFYHVVKIPASAAGLGPNETAAPAGTKYGVRIIADDSGQMIDRYFFLSDWNEIISFDTGEANYDPRQRPWYEIAARNGFVSISDVYTFAGSKQPGITISRVVLDELGETSAVVGADISLRDLAEYLGEKRIGERGRTFILDAAGQKVVQSETAGGTPTHDRLSDPDVELAIAHFQAEGANNFTVEGDDTVMGTFIPFPNNYGKDWVIGVVADRSEFVRDINQATLRTLIVGLLTAALTVILIALFSRILTRPLRHIVREAGLIREFEITEGFNIKSNVIEIDELAKAIEAMKNSLRSFAAYVPISLVRTIVASGTPVEIGGQTKQLTLLFSDIQSFTSKSEQLAPKLIFEELSDYFSVMTQAIRENNGTVDKFIGDAVMAFWNAPLDDPAHTENACRAALTCQLKCRDLNQRARGDGDGASILPVTTRIGLHTGDVMVGNVGSDDRMQYTAMGPTVNLASRIEAVNKKYGTELLITDAIAGEVKDQFEMRQVDLIAPVGTSKPVAIFELLGEKDQTSKVAVTDRQRTLCQHWRDCYRHYEAREWQTAASAFEHFLRDYPDDKPAAIYLERCQLFAAEPPPADWDGVQTFDSK